MKKNILLLLLLLNFNPQLPISAQGSLTPPGVPAATMKTLAQIEPRVPISSVPFTISVPGAYYVTTNLTVTVSNGITIATNGVTLDLGGWTISSTVASAKGCGILINDGLSDITIQNGHIRGGVTNNGSGVYNGPGFASGIFFPTVPSRNVLVSRISVSGCLLYGIVLNIGDSTVVESCTARTIGSYGIRASTIKSSVAIDCGGFAIDGDQVSDCRGTATGSGFGIYANTANNCYGSSSGSGTGLQAYDIAIGCHGDSSSGTGLNANVANSCVGYSTTGISQIIANKYNMP